MTNDEVEELGNIERILMERRVPLEDINRHCALFLLGLIDNISSPDELKGDVAEVAHLLKSICKPQFLETHDSKEHLATLWRTEIKYREKLSELSLIARCAILCCANKAEWDRENSGEETPLYYFTHTAEKINSKYVKVLIEHFKKLIPS